ncbi:MAG: FeoA family protein [Candidatus Bathyarchaeia archaeon]
MESENSELKTPLTTLKAGETGIIVSISPNPGRKGWRHGGGYGCAKRLMDMGLTPGTKVEVSKSAPFHGPIEVIVRGSRLALGRGMAERIIVEKTK